MTRGRDDFPLLPAYVDDERTVKCGLPAEVRCRFTMRSTDGPLESAMIRCPAGHRVNGTIESLTWDSANKHNPGTAAAPSVAGHGRLRAPVMAVTAKAGSPSMSSPPGRGRLPAARTALLPTIWDGPPTGGSPACGAASPHPATPCKPSPVAGREHHLWVAATGPEPGRNRPYDTCHCAVAEGKDRYGRHGPAACRHHRSLLGHRCPVRRPPGRRRTEPGVGTWFRFWPRHSELIEKDDP